MNYAEIIQQNTRRLLAEKDMSQREACQRSGISETGLSFMLLGKRAPGMDMVLGLAKAFRVEPWVLMAPAEDYAALSTDGVMDVVRALSRLPPDQVSAIVRVVEMAVGQTEQKATAALD